MSKMYARILSSLCLIVLSNFIYADDQVTLQLKGEANIRTEWRGHGISVRWSPEIYNPKFDTLQKVLDENAGYFHVFIEDESNLAAKDQWLSLEKKLNLKKQLTSPHWNPPPIFERTSRDFRAKHYLLDGNRLPIYVYGVRETKESYARYLSWLSAQIEAGGSPEDYQEFGGSRYAQRAFKHEYEEYLDKTIHVSIPYTGPVKAYYESWKKRQHVGYEEKVAARTNQRFVLALLGFISILILWLLRNQLIAVLSWLGIPLRNLRNNRLTKNEHKQLLRTKELFDADLLSQEEYDSRIAKIKSP
jgi:hypothetical protein